MTSRIIRPEAVQSSSPAQSSDKTFLRFTAWDYDAIKQDLVSYVEENFGEDFNDFVESSYGVMLLELIAFAFDRLSFKVDALLNESFLQTARQRKSTVLLAKLLGYQARGKTSAIARVSATLSASYPNDVVIPAGTKVSVSAATEDGGGIIQFELYSLTDDGSVDLDSDIVIPASQLTNTSIVAVEGVTATQTSVSDGSSSLRVKIQKSDIVESWISARVDGEEWERVDYFDGQAKEFAVDQDPDGTWNVVFGDGRDGLVPQVGASIVVSYRVGGGSRGNVVRGYINKVINVPVKNTAGNAPVTVFNYERGSGGAEAQSLEEVKRAATALFRARDRAVTVDDYVSIAESFLSKSHGKVSKAACATRHSGCSANVVDLYVVAVQSATELTRVSDSLKSALKAHLEERKCLTHRVSVRDAESIPFAVTVAVRSPRGFGRGAVEVENAVRARLEADFSAHRAQIGRGVRKSDVVRSISALSGVEFVDAEFVVDERHKSTVNGDVEVDYWEVAQMSTISVNVSLF